MRGYVITVSFTDRASEEEITHTETVKAQDEAELKQIVPKLLLALSQTGYVGYSPDRGWRLYPGNQMDYLRAEMSPVQS